MAERIAMIKRKFIDAETDDSNGIKGSTVSFVNGAYDKRVYIVTH